MKTDVKTDTNLMTGERTYSVRLEPLPIMTPVGIAPGEVVIRVNRQGRLIALEVLSNPNVLVFRGSLKRLAEGARWDIPVEELSRIGAHEHPIVHFKLKANIVPQVLVPIQGPKALGALLQHPLLQNGENYDVEDIEIES